MKNLILQLAVVCTLLNGCSKENPIIPAKKELHTISIVPIVKGVTDWNHILSGKAYIDIVQAPDDSLSLSSIKDSLDLKVIQSYKRQILAGRYDITLRTASSAVSDTLLRFSATAKSALINSDQVLKLSAETVDGLITIGKNLIKGASVPTFLQTGTSNPVSFGFANDSYFLYVKGGTVGRISFIEATSGDTFIKDVKVTSLTQHNLIPKLGMTNYLLTQTRFSN